MKEIQKTKPHRTLRFSKHLHSLGPKNLGVEIIESPEEARVIGRKMAAKLAKQLKLKLDV